MADGGGFNLAGGGAVQGGTIYIGVALKDFDKFKQAMGQVQGESEKTAKSAKNQLGEAFSGLISQMAMMVSAAAVMQEAMAGLKHAMAEELSLAKARALMEGFGLATDANVSKLDAMAASLANVAGVAEESTIGTFTNLLGVLRGNYQAAYDLTLMLEKVKVMLPQGGQLAEVLTGAIGSGTNARLGRTFGRAGIPGVKDAGDAVKALNDRLVALDIVLNASAIQMAAFKEQWRNFTADLVGDFAPPLIVALKGIATAFMTAANALASWWGILQTIGVASGRAFVGGDFYGKMKEEWGKNVLPLWSKGSIWGKQTQSLWGKGNMPEGGMSIEALIQAVMDALAANSEGVGGKGDKRLTLGGGPGLSRKWKSGVRGTVLGEEGFVYEDMIERRRRIEEAEADAWQKANDMKIRGVKEFGSIAAQFLVELPREGMNAWARFGENLIAMLQRIAAQLLETWITAKLLATLGLAAGGGAGYEHSAGFVGPIFTPQGIGGVRPIPTGGGVTVNITGTSGGGVLSAVYRGSTLVERRQVARDIWIVGGTQAMAGA